MSDWLMRMVGKLWCEKVKDRGIWKNFFVDLSFATLCKSRPQDTELISDLPKNPSGIRAYIAAKKPAAVHICKAR